MNRLDWPDLFERILPQLELKSSGEPDRDGWVTARCINAANHRNGDEHHSLRINVKAGSVKCMSQDCAVGPNLNNLAKLLGIDTDDDRLADAPPGNGRVGTLAELASSRNLPIEALRETWGVTAEKKGWRIPIDDPEAASFQRWKRYPWASGPKYWWAPKGCPASDLVYNLSRIDPATEDLFIAAGEPDTWVLHHAGLPAVSFLAGENAAPSTKAIEKMKAALPKLKSVHLPYDRDDAGKRGGLKVAASLVTAGIAVDIITLPDDLPETGDIGDLWMSCDGDAEAFLRRLYGCDIERMEPQQPHVERREDDAYTIYLPCQGGWVRVDADRVSASKQKLEAEIGVSVDLPGMMTQETFAASVNMLSLSTRRTLAGELSSMFPDLPWTQLVNSASGELRRAFYGVEPALDLATVEPRESDRRYRVGIVLPEGKTVSVFGDGGGGKGWTTDVLAVSTAYGRCWYGLDVVQGRVMVVDWEDDEQTASDRIKRLCMGAGLTLQPGLIDYWPANGRAFADIADAVGRKVRRDNIAMLIIDSAAYACGGDPSDSDNTIRFFNALKPIGVTSPIICHVPKDSDQEKPYGSVFWHNASRMTWNIRKVQAEGEHAMSVGLYCKKANDTSRPRPIGLRFTFDGETGPVTVERQDVRDVPELQGVRSVKDQLRDALRRVPPEGKLTADLAEELGKSEDAIYKALARDPGIRNLSTTRGVPARWVLSSSRENGR